MQVPYIFLSLLMLFPAMSWTQSPATAPEPTDKQKVFPGRTIVAVGAKDCSNLDNSDPTLIIDMTMLMLRDFENHNTAVEMAGYICEIIIGNDVWTIVDSAVVTGYEVDIFHGSKCQGDAICHSDTSWIFKAFEPAEINESEMVFLDMTRHDGGVMANLFEQCPCEGTREKALSRRTIVNYKMYRSRTELGQTETREFEGYCTFCEPCQLEGN